MTALAKGAAAAEVFSVALKIIPSAPLNAIVGRRGEEIVVKINAPPDDGKANRVLIDFLSSSLGLAKRDIQLVRGATSRHKIIVLPLSAKSKLESLCST